MKYLDTSIIYSPMLLNENGLSIILIHCHVLETIGASLSFFLKMQKYKKKLEYVHSKNISFPFIVMQTLKKICVYFISD